MTPAEEDRTEAATPESAPSSEATGPSETEAPSGNGQAASGPPTPPTYETDAPFHVPGARIEPLQTPKTERTDVPEEPEEPEEERARASGSEEEAPTEPDAEDPSEPPKVENVSQAEPLELTEPASRDEKREPSEVPQTASREAQQLVDDLSRQHQQRIDQVLSEAEEMERQAEELKKKAKQQAQLRKEYAKHADYVEKLAPELGFDPSRPVTEVPEIEREHIEEIEFTTIKPERSYVRILFDERTNRYLYQVIEPQLSSVEEDVLEFLEDTLIRTLDGRFDDEETDWEAYLEDAVEQAVLDHSILVDHVAKQRLQYHVKRDFLGYGPIDVMMQDPMIEDISCDGPGIPIYIFHRQYESIKSNVVVEDEQDLDSFVIRLAQRSGKHISIADPLLDATLPDTSRLQASLSREVTTRGSSFTIRKFRSDPLTPPDLIRLGTMNSRMAGLYWMAMENGAPMIMAGGTASGKTTTLNALGQFVPPAKKIVSIEDTREINLQHENWIAGLTRSGFGEEKGEGSSGSVGMFQLLKSALRQRPEYLLVGEVRGEEAQTLFQAMATGHATYSTLHADSVMSAVYRLENEPIDIPRLMLQTLDTISVQIQTRVDNRLVRRIKEVTEIAGIDPRTGDLLTNTVYKWDPKTDEYEYLGKSHILEKIMEKNNLEPDEVERDWANRTLVLDWMVDQGIRNITEVSEVVSAYYARPDEVVERIKQAVESETEDVDVSDLGHPDTFEEAIGDGA